MMSDTNLFFQETSIWGMALFAKCPCMHCTHDILAAHTKLLDFSHGSKAKNIKMRWLEWLRYQNISFYLTPHWLLKITLPSKEVGSLRQGEVELLNLELVPNWKAAFCSRWNRNQSLLFAYHLGDRICITKSPLCCHDHGIVRIFYRFAV